MVRRSLVHKTEVKTFFSTDTPCASMGRAPPWLASIDLGHCSPGHPRVCMLEPLDWKSAMPSKEVAQLPFFFETL